MPLILQSSTSSTFSPSSASPSLSLVSSSNLSSVFLLLKKQVKKFSLYFPASIHRLMEVMEKK